jgi:hypothetical protein
MFCELYISLTASDFVDKQVRIHRALSYAGRMHGELHRVHFMAGVAVREDVLRIMDFTEEDLIDLSSYTDPIAIVLKFCQGLNSTTQDRIAESGMDRLSDTDFNGWFKAA